MPTESTRIENSFDKLYTRHYRRAFLFAKSYIHDEPAAEDIASEALIRLWQWMRDNPGEPGEAMLLTILKNKSLDYLKHEAVKQQAFAHITEWRNEELALRISSLEECNPNEIFSKEVTGIVQDTLRTLPEKTSRVFSLSRFSHKTNKEIAEELCISVKDVEYHITKALKVFRSALKDYLPLFYFLFYQA